MRRTFLKSTVVILAISAIITGCSSTPKPKAENEGFACMQDGVKAPSFTCKPNNVDGYIVALGVAQMNSGNDKTFQRTEAMGAGRDAIARQIEVKVSNLLKQYRGTTGAGKNATFDKVSSDVSKQIASQTLSGSKQIGYSWRNPKTKELFILVGVPNDSVKDKMDSAIKSSFKNDAALYQQFLAEKANGNLDKELDKEK